MTKTTKSGILALALGIVVQWAFLANKFPLRPLYALILGNLAGFLFLLLALALWFVNRGTYLCICPHCNAVFKPTFKPSPYLIKFFNKHLVKCKQCGKKDYMEFLKDEPAATLGEEKNK